MKAFIFAAGKGTRLKPFTDNHPKALALVNGVPLLERNIKYLQSFGINDFIINVHHFGNQIIDFLVENQNFGAKISISDEKEELLETGGGLVFGKNFLEKEENFLVMNADILTDLNISQLIDFHLSQGNLATLAVSDRESSRKLLFDDEMLLRGWVNKTTGENIIIDRESSLNEFAFSGVHCINFSIFEHIKRTGKFSIMTEYLDLMRNHQIKGFLHNAKLIDVGRPESVIEAEKFFL